MKKILLAGIFSLFGITAAEAASKNNLVNLKGEYVNKNSFHAFTSGSDGYEQELAFNKPSVLGSDCFIRMIPLGEKYTIGKEFKLRMDNPEKTILYTLKAYKDGFDIQVNYSEILLEHFGDDCNEDALNKETINKMSGYYKRIK
jgi:hypothetical protein